MCVCVRVNNVVRGACVYVCANVCVCVRLKNVGDGLIRNTFLIRRCVFMCVCECVNVFE